MTNKLDNLVSVESAASASGGFVPSTLAHRNPASPILVPDFRQPNALLNIGLPDSQGCEREGGFGGGVSLFAHPTPAGCIGILRIAFPSWVLLGGTFRDAFPSWVLLGGTFRDAFPSWVLPGGTFRDAFPSWILLAGTFRDAFPSWGMRGGMFRDAFPSPATPLLN